MAYQPTIPSGTIPLNQDYLNIQGNFTALNNTFSIDHSPLTGTLPPGGTAGYHTNIHSVPFSTTVSNPPNNNPPTEPTATAGYGQIWSAEINDGLNTDQSLFFLTGGNRDIKLTMNFVPSAIQTGYTFLPGGLILMWGFSAIPGPSFTTVISFPKIQGAVAFPNACFNVQLTSLKSALDGDGVFVLSSSVNKDTFTVRNTSLTNTNVYWMALGN